MIESVERPKIKVYRADELLAATFPEPKWIIPDILPEGVTTLVAPPKIGKSWLALDVAITTSIGGVVLNRRVPKIGSLYLSLEDNARRLQHRIVKQTSLEDLPVIPRDCHITTAWPCDGERFVYLHNYIEANPEIKVIIVDTLMRFAPVRDGNDYAQTTAVFAAIRRFAEDRGVSLLIVHHARKGSQEGGGDYIDGVLGSTGIAGGSDATISITRRRGQHDGVMRITGREVPEQELACHFDTQTCRWSIQGAASEVQESRERQDIIDILKSSKKPLKPKEISDALKKSPGSVRYLLHKMVSSGAVESLFSGGYALPTPLTTPNTPNSANTPNIANTPNGGEL